MKRAQILSSHVRFVYTDNIFPLHESARHIEIDSYTQRYYLSLQPKLPTLHPPHPIQHNNPALEWTIASHIRIVLGLNAVHMSSCQRKIIIRDNFHHAYGPGTRDTERVLFNNLVSYLKDSNPSTTKQWKSHGYNRCYRFDSRSISRAESHPESRQIILVRAYYWHAYERLQPPQP